MRPVLENPFYYLDNFQRVLAWVGRHHGDLLDDAERDFIDRFAQLPQASRALLVRMVMRKGTLFRASKLNYAEIGCVRQAAKALVAHGWLDPAPLLSLEALSSLLTKGELLRVFPVGLPAQLRKAEVLEQLRAQHREPRSFADWCGRLDDQAFALAIDALCERLRLMFFGNLHQGWSDFVLADLGIHRYEQVAFSPDSRAFHCRRELDAYLQLWRCRERFEAGESAAAVLAEVPMTAYANAWLESRRGKLLLRIGQQLERQGELGEALKVHAANSYPGARERAIRVLERCDQLQAALQLALQAQAAPQSEQEAQQLARILPRLRRRLGQPGPVKAPTAQAVRLDLCLPYAPSVERAVAAHLATADAPVHYVENTLIASLFGLLCWDAIFAPLPGAFFHPFHWAPADLDRADFHLRRAELFASCLACLDDGNYRTRILRTYREKSGIHNAFVTWGLLDQALLEQALDCLPTAHLQLIFKRLLADLPGNRSGLPDLIQFWPAERRYRMIEVKGPGDRLQDNQKRWIEFAGQHELPITLCYVKWATP